MKKYDLVVIGGGPAGLTAGIYAARYHLKVLVVAGSFGGLTAEAHQICNFPSYEGITGLELTKKFKDHALSAGVEVKQALVNKVVKEKLGFRVFTNTGEEFLAKTIILALGMKHRKLSLPSEKKFLGKGISYCFTCDGMFYQGKPVAVIGGSDAAVTAALYFSDICPEVYIIYRKAKLRAEPAWLKLVKGKKNIKVIYNTNAKDAYGKEKLEGVILDNPYQGKEKLPIEGLFIEIGEVPDKALLEPLAVAVDEFGFVKIDQAGKTNVIGVWAAGDFTNGSNGLRQIITAGAEGAIAAQDIFKYLQEEKEENNNGQ